MQRALGVFIALMALLLAATPSAAATAISYSAPDNIYGWCAGYGAGRSPGCAADACAQQGGKSCREVLACNGGWGSVAFAENPVAGFAADCAGGDPFSARAEVLAACVVASNALCWTDSTFDGRGSSRSANDDKQFDLAWYTQLLLQVRSYLKSNADGSFGPQSQQALAAFQTAMGATANGVPDEPTIRQLIDADGGMQVFVATLKRDILDPNQEKFANYVYSTVATPAPSQSFSEELMQRPEEQRLTALATYLTAHGTKCTLPARNATAVPDASSGLWDVDCAEGDMTVMMSPDGSSMVTGGSNTIIDTGNGTTTITDNGSNNASAPGGGDQGTSSSGKNEQGTSTPSSDGNQPQPAATPDSASQSDQAPAQPAAAPAGDGPTKRPSGG